MKRPERQPSVHVSSAYLDILSEYLNSETAVPRSAVAEDSARPDALIEFCHVVQRSRSALSEQNFSAQAAEFTQSALRRLTTLCASYDGAGFEQAAAQAYAGPEAFRREAERAFALDREPEGAHSVVEMAAYVDRAEVAESQSRVPLHELRIDRRLVLERLSAALAFRAPHQIEEMAGNFRVFQRRFVDAYVAHHLEVQADANAALPELHQDGVALEALAKLNSLKRLGPPLGVDLRARLDAIENRLKPCAVEEAALRARLNEAPQCASCGLTLNDGVPESERAAIHADLHAALQQKQRGLATAMAARSAAGTDGTPLQRFLDAAQAADVGPLVDVMSESALWLIESILDDN